MPMLLGPPNLMGLLRDHSIIARGPAVPGPHTSSKALAAVSQSSQHLLLPHPALSYLLLDWRQGVKEV